MSPILDEFEFLRRCGKDFITEKCLETSPTRLLPATSRIVRAFLIPVISAVTVTWPQTVYHCDVGVSADAVGWWVLGRNNGSFVADRMLIFELVFAAVAATVARAGTER